MFTTTDQPWRLFNVTTLVLYRLRCRTSRDMFASGSVSSWLHLLQQGRAQFTPTNPSTPPKTRQKKSRVCLYQLSNQSRINMDSLNNACTVNIWDIYKTKWRKPFNHIEWISWKYQYICQSCWWLVCVRAWVNCIIDLDAFARRYQLKGAQPLSSGSPP